MTPPGPPVTAPLYLRQDHCPQIDSAHHRSSLSRWDCNGSSAERELLTSSEPDGTTSSEAGVSAPSGAANTDSCESGLAEECADIRSARISPNNFVVSAMAVMSKANLRSSPR